MNNNEKTLINFIHLIENMNYSDFLKAYNEDLFFDIHNFNDYKILFLLKILSNQNNHSDYLNVLKIIQILNITDTKINYSLKEILINNLIDINYHYTVEILIAIFIDLNNTNIKLIKQFYNGLNKKFNINEFVDYYILNNKFNFNNFLQFIKINNVEIYFNNNEKALYTYITKNKNINIQTCEDILSQFNNNEKLLSIKNSNKENLYFDLINHDYNFIDYLFNKLYFNNISINDKNKNYESVLDFLYIEINKDETILNKEKTKKIYYLFNLFFKKMYFNNNNNFDIDNLVKYFNINQIIEFYAITLLQENNQDNILKILQNFKRKYNNINYLNILETCLNAYLNDYILSPENYKQTPLMKIEDLRSNFIFIKKNIYF